MIVWKKINNNVAICRDGNQRELIAFGRGIGFPATPYELTDLSKIDRTFYNVNRQYIPLLNEIPEEVIQFTARMINLVQDQLPHEISSNLVLTLSDHIAFAMERAKKGIYLPMPSIYELEFSYPVEVQIGRQFVSEIFRTFKVRMPKGEVQCIANHFINARHLPLAENAGSQLEQRYDEILEGTTRIIEQELKVEVQRDTFSYARFATHIQYLLKRVFEQKHIDSENLQMYRSVREEFQEVSACADRICDYWRTEWSVELSEEETLYLIMHINRVCSQDAP